MGRPHRSFSFSAAIASCSAAPAQVASGAAGQSASAVAGFRAGSGAGLQRRREPRMRRRALQRRAAPRRACPPQRRACRRSARRRSRETPWCCGPARPRRVRGMPTAEQFRQPRRGGARAAHPRDVHIADLAVRRELRRDAGVSAPRRARTQASQCTVPRVAARHASRHAPPPAHPPASRCSRGCPPARGAARATRQRRGVLAAQCSSIVGIAWRKRARAFSEHMPLMLGGPLAGSALMVA